MNQKRHVEGNTDDLDQPTPPGGPNRTDAPDGPFSPGRPAVDPGPEVERVTKRADGEHAPPAEHDEGREQSSREAERQEENAEQSDFGEPSQ